MELAILAQDIDSLSLASIEDQSIHKECTLYGSPEQYLTLIDETLRDWKITLHQLSAVIVVTGPGSFTASRVSTTIANTIGFVCRIPVTAVENPENLSLMDLLLSKTIDHVTAPFALPTYNRPAHITQARQPVDETVEILLCVIASDPWERSNPLNCLETERLLRRRTPRNDRKQSISTVS